jgi:cellulose synthase/poly-beta-1,6-N-acetylglucosamine synthase-like glycosyltransferase
MNSKDSSLSFSVVVETENLVQADMGCLHEALESLSNQESPINKASAVLVQDSGNVPDVVLEELNSRFPWISFVQIPHDRGQYYEAKMIFMEEVRSDIVIFCDSDCIFEPSWLGNLLRPFALDPAIEMVGGETQMKAKDPFSLAMVLTHVFSLYSQNEDLFMSDHYYANNVAFRAVFLREHPLPGNLPIFRGNCYLHARELIDQGVKIWRQPKSRSVHAVPDNWQEFFKRFIRMGSDSVQVSRLAAFSGEKKRSLLHGTAIASIASKCAETFRRVWQIRTRDPQPLNRMLFATPIVLLALCLFSGGALSQSLAIKSKA